MNSGKLLKISDERSIYILQNEDGTYVSKDNIIKYRNIGKSFEIKQIQESHINIDANGQLHILDGSGNSKFHFPSIWLDTISMKIIELKEIGIIK